MPKYRIFFVDYLEVEASDFIEAERAFYEIVDQSIEIENIERVDDAV